MWLLIAGSEAASSHTPEKKTSKNGINHAQHSDSGSATRHFNAKVARADRASGGDGYYLGSTVRSSIAASRVAPHEMGKSQKEEYNKMLRPGFEPGISDSKGRYA